LKYEATALRDGTRHVKGSSASIALDNQHERESAKMTCIYGGVRTESRPGVALCQFNLAAIQLICFGTKLPPFAVVGPNQSLQRHRQSTRQ
jgi:hypothetical protein